MDEYDPGHICNHSDEEGRYSYVGLLSSDPASRPTLTPDPQRNQPSMGVYAVQKLGIALAELIGCEEDLANLASTAATGYVEVDVDWAEGGDIAGWMDGWRKVGMERVEEVKLEFQKIFTDEYTSLMRLVRPSSSRLSARLVVLTSVLCYSAWVSSPMARTTSTSSLNFSTSSNSTPSTTRTLSAFSPSSPLRPRPPISPPSSPTSSHRHLRTMPLPPRTTSHPGSTSTPPASRSRGR